MVVTRQALDAAAAPEPDGHEILEVAWLAREDLEELDLAPDMVQIAPAAFEWLASR